MSRRRPILGLDDPGIGGLAGKLAHISRSSLQSRGVVGDADHLEVMTAERNGIADAGLESLGSIFGQSDLVGLRRPGPVLDRRPAEGLCRNLVEVDHHRIMSVGCRHGRRQHGVNSRDPLGFFDSSGDLIGVGNRSAGVDDNVGLRGGNGLFLAQRHTLGTYEHRDTNEEPNRHCNGNEGCDQPTGMVTQLSESLSEHQPSNPAIASLTDSAVGEAMSSTMRPSNNMRVRSA